VRDAYRLLVKLYVLIKAAGFNRATIMIDVWAYLYKFTGGYESLAVELNGLQSFASGAKYYYFPRH
jgi:hypothetical protein